MFTFADAFAGIGGFHTALSGLGGNCVWACENDAAAAATYWNNWKVEAFRDITVEAPADGLVSVPPHDVFTAGFPCQPFSKSGQQRGMEEARGTLFYNVARVLETQKPSVVILENVRNLAGPRHRHEWDVIITTLRELGYRVSSEPAVMSPHLLPPDMGGAPQVRDRVFITATYVGDQPGFEMLLGEELPALVHPKAVAGWRPQDWSVDDWLTDIHGDEEKVLGEKFKLTDEEKVIFEVWNDFLRSVAVDEKLPGFPIWADELKTRPRNGFDPSLPAWKVNFLEKNAAFFSQHSKEIRAWKSRWKNLKFLPASRRKFEWQAGASKRDLYECLIQLRPSGVRVKAATYLPAFVAITQTSIIGPRKRRISPMEAARIQGLPVGFSFGDQSDKSSYKQVGNGVHAGVVQYVLRQHVERDQKWIPKHIVKAVLNDAATKVQSRSKRQAI